jgi:hypothetical protein
VEDVIKISRDHLRTNQTVWVMKDGKLEIREVAVVLSDAESTYINEGLEPQDLVVTTSLSTVVDGIGLRTETDQPAEKETGMKVSATEE